MPRKKDDWILIGGVAAGVASFLLFATAILTM